MINCLMGHCASAIGRASYAKKMRAMKLLLDAGASGKAEDKFGAPVWYYADDEEMRVMLGGAWGHRPYMCL